MILESKSRRFQRKISIQIVQQMLLINFGFKYLGILQKRASPRGREHMLTYTSDTVLEHII